MRKLQICLLFSMSLSLFPAIAMSQGAGPTAGYRVDPEAAARKNAERVDRLAWKKACGPKKGVCTEPVQESPGLIAVLEVTDREITEIPTPWEDRVKVKKKKLLVEPQPNITYSCPLQGQGRQRYVVWKDIRKDAIMYFCAALPPSPTEETGRG